MTVTPDALGALLDHLNADATVPSHTWREWSITPISGGANNLLYRATSPSDDLAIKFTVRDDRDRAGREFAALSALHRAGLHIAPQAVWLDQHRYRQPVVVQTWLEGEVLTKPPQSATDWESLLQHYCALHTLTPMRAGPSLAEASLNVASGALGKTLVHQQVQRLPSTAQPPSLQALLRRLDAWTSPAWPTSPRALCRVDGNWRNFIRQGKGLASVDWENSGWGDPAFEIADLMTHPAYADIADAPWDWLSTVYGERVGDQTATLRIQTYYTIMRVWWVVRWARYLYEVPRGLDARLVARPPTWQSETERRYEQYVTRAEEHMARLG
jgi:aminoglycoside phosphotransferase (APT) family kinase protein